MCVRIVTIKGLWLAIPGRKKTNSNINLPYTNIRKLLSKYFREISIEHVVNTDE